ncbi:serine hydrolase domain-containing protein [Kitasatospora paranensis]|uniref:Serine hydrolase domain-containing protein n=1 Tax=Kitasatospora paranensis TaxID=258053 RepID=A0ABW2FUA3_9ACTN
MSARPLPPRRLHRPGRCATALLAAAALVALVPADAEAGGRPDSPSSLQHRLDELVRAAGGPPGAIAILRRGDRSEVYRSGVAEVGEPGAPRADDHMRIASVAKAFSGAVALRLVDRGALGLDDTLGQRLPDLPAAWAAVTLRQLLQHTSGLPDYSDSAAFRAVITADPHHVFDSRHLLDYVADQGLLFTPGSSYRYSNSDNIAVALMAEAATGRRYEELLGRLVDRPLGLRDTGLPQGYRLPEPYLHGYDVTPPDAPVDVSTLFGASGAWASGGIVSTPADLSTFIGAYGGGRLVTAPTRRQQLAFVPGASEPAGPGTNAAGLALFRYTTRCGVVYGHTGNTAGYTQFAAATPDGRGSVTVSVSEQISQSTRPALLARLRDVEENFVCALLNDRP